MAGRDVINGRTGFTTKWEAVDAGYDVGYSKASSSLLGSCGSSRLISVQSPCHDRAWRNRFPSLCLVDCATRRLSALETTGSKERCIASEPVTIDSPSNTRPRAGHCRDVRRKMWLIILQNQSKLDMSQMVPHACRVRVEAFAAASPSSLRAMDAGRQQAVASVV